VRQQLLKLLRMKLRFGPLRVELWQVASLAIGLPLCALNLAVGYFGGSAVFPLSPFHLADKVWALGRYAMHRPICLVRGHPEVDAVVVEAERVHGLPRGLMASVVEMESSNRPHRISPVGAMGPAQLMPGTAELLGVADPYDTRDSILGGAKYLASNLQRFHNVSLAVAAYNAGPGAVGSSVPKNGETEVYVQRVMEAYSRRRALYRAEQRLKARLNRSPKPASR
jgi:soluble lytic murein transglycosylase-like protein